MRITTQIKLALGDPKRAFRWVFVKMPRFAERYVPLNEIFIAQEYKWLFDRIKPNTTVIDIGAFIGDSAIYFSFNPNVSKVIAYELAYRNYREARENLARIGLLGKRVILHNAGVDGSRGVLSVDESYGNTDARIEKMPQGTHKIPLVSIKDVLKGQNRVVIKSDAEGAEHRIFTPEADLSKVYAIQMEYHDGVKNLPEVLRKKGFKVKVTEKGGPSEGLVYAERTK